MAGSPGENHVGPRKREALGVESVGEGMRELGPTGKAEGQGEGGDGDHWHSHWTRLFQKAEVTGQLMDHRPRLGHPGLQVDQAGKAFPDASGDGVGGLAPGKPLRDKKDIPEPPAADGQQKGG